MLSVNESLSLASAEIQLEKNRRALRCIGVWTIANINVIEKQLTIFNKLSEIPLTIDASAIIAMDTAGAWLLLKLINQFKALSKNEAINVIGLQNDHQALLDLIINQNIAINAITPQTIGTLEALGRQVIAHFEQGYALLVFLGEITLVLFKTLLSPKRLRVQAVFQDLQTAGVNALPIVGLISFLMGTVIAYQGGMQLRYYGANLFVVDLVGVSLLRELAPLLTAIIVAGRTGSAYTAQLGTMRVTDEIDALRTIGIDPLELLVIPKIIALILALPLLTVYADILGVLGGMVVSHFMLDVDPYSFIIRFPEAVNVIHYYIGLGKSPIFAGIIALVGCFQGMRVGDSAAAVGYQVTISVVQAIFLVIVADAVFSIILSLLKI